METQQLLQLVTAICFSAVGIVFLLRARQPGMGHSARLAGFLFLLAAAINWLLFARLFG